MKTRKIQRFTQHCRIYVRIDKQSTFSCRFAPFWSSVKESASSAWKCQIATKTLFIILLCNEAVLRVLLYVPLVYVSQNRSSQRILRSRRQNSIMPCIPTVHLRFTACLYYLRLTICPNLICIFSKEIYYSFAYEIAWLIVTMILHFSHGNESDGRKGMLNIVTTSLYII